MALKKNQSRTKVLLASYNGEKYIKDQLESIIGVYKGNVYILVSDDGSKDSTVSIIESFVENRADSSLTFNKSEVKGHKGNFTNLCDFTFNNHFDYFCFCDQDDVWLPDKLLIQQKRMSELEALHGKDTPILIHSDLELVDKHLLSIHPSFMKHQQFTNPQHYLLEDLLYQNIVTGCTCFFNRALLEVANPIPLCSPVHDWWFALCAKTFGVLDYIDQPLVKYRQHGNNSIGAKGHSEQRNFFNLQTYKTLYNYPSHIVAAVQQANTLLETINNNYLSVKKDDLDVIDQFAHIQTRNAFKRICFAKKLFKGKRPLLERFYLYFVFFIIRWMKL